MQYSFINKETGHEQKTSDSAMFIWALLFGPLYFFSKGAWLWGFAAFGLAFVTFGVSHLLFPFAARSIVFDALRRNGYVSRDSALGEAERVEVGPGPMKRLVDAPEPTEPAAPVEWLPFYDEWAKQWGIKPSEPRSRLDAYYFSDNEKLVRDLARFLNKVTVHKRRKSPLREHKAHEEYEAFWKELVETDGKIDMEKLKNELYDFSFMMEQVSKVYEHVTGGLLSKTNYYAETVITEADRHYEERFADDRAAEQEETTDESP